MTIPDYGVWVAKPTSFTAQRAKQDAKSPHIYLKFKNDLSDSTEYEAAINAKSTDSDSRLVYWLVKDLKADFSSTLTKLTAGFHSISSGDGTGLDYLRGGMIDLSKGEILQSDVPGPNNDIIDEVSPILQSGIDDKATAYIFGSQYSEKDGIHDIHMNQGSLPKYENGVGQDGGIFFEFADGHWECIFIAFASQEVPTDDKTGEPASGAKTLASIAKGSG